MTPDTAGSTPDKNGASDLCVEFEQQWNTGSEPPAIEPFLARGGNVDPSKLFRDLLVVDLRCRRSRLMPVVKDPYRGQFPQFRGVVDEVFQACLSDTLGRGSAEANTEITRALDLEPFAASNSAEMATTIALAVPERIGRYEFMQLLGAGGFGQVFLALDTDLERYVAIKIPHKHRIASAGDIALFLAEARTLASLDHPGVVPIYDFGRIEDRCYVVTKLIEGETLRQRQRRQSLSAVETIDVLISMAETLQFIHSKGVVHRDIKPGNILLDKAGHCFLADFGLALRDENFGQGSGYLGTVGYMSPEQVRGEGHLVDGRSDLFSLGVVMYELLTGVQPFVKEDHATVLVMIAHEDPQPLRQRQPNLPKELERICLRLLSKRASDRHSQAKDLVDDLRHFQAAGPVSRNAPVILAAMQDGRPQDSQQQLVGIVPRGLRSFDQEDANFFRELLPGPRDRDGLPDSLRFWTRRIDTDDPTDAFRVGVIYGPSGSGKSSFVKAGLLPLLKSGQKVVFIEASTTDTEQRLLEGLRRRIPDLPVTLTLGDSLAWIRRMSDTTQRPKVLLVIDQFEQWLHAEGENAEAELATALRQCDGRHLQCLLLVRDDFWLAISRLAERIEVDLVRNRNLAMVDLFDKKHGQKVLAEYGRAYERLPNSLATLSKGQEAFLTQAIDGLAEGGKLIPVQLATFAEIMKSRDWDAKSLHELGGTRGVGVWFLEESFSSSNAPAQNRVHEGAVQALLKSLLPEADSNIKGAMRSEAELLEVSGYAEQPRLFSQLISILDTELKLITPTERRQRGGKSDSGPGPQRFYQLTHDFLVPAVREWLERRQQQTMRGRAAMRLASRAEVWTSRPDNHHLPSWLEWASFLILTRPSQRSPNEQRMLAVATMRHGIATLVSLALIVLLAWGGNEFRNRSRSIALTDQIRTASIREVPGILTQLDGVRRHSRAPLESLQSTTTIDTSAGLHARLALLRRNPEDHGLSQELQDFLLTAKLDVLPLLRDELAQHPLRSELTRKLWEKLESSKASVDERFRAGLVLAKLDPPSSDLQQSRWNQDVESLGPNDKNTLPLKMTVGEWMGQEIVAQSPYPGEYTAILQLIRPARDAVLPRLLDMHRRENDTPERLRATSFVLDLLDDSPARLAQAYLDADDSQIPRFLKRLDDAAETLFPDFRLVCLQFPTEEQSAAEQQHVANRQINAAVFLLRHRQEVALHDLFQHRTIPNTRSGLIERIVTFGGHAGSVFPLLRQTTDDGVRSAVLLLLGSYGAAATSEAQRTEWRTAARELFQTHPSADVHSAAEWLLRQLGDEAWMTETTRALSGKPVAGVNGWSINTHEQTLVLARTKDHSFEIDTTEVTMGELLRFKSSHDYAPERAPDPRCAAIQAEWYDAIGYCRWLTEQEGLGEDQQCYPPLTPDRTQVRLHNDYQLRRGYRPPTSEEWEAANFGMAKTRFFFGYDTHLTHHYASVLDDSNLDFYAISPTRIHKPNPLGIFDTIGNVTEWCAEADSFSKDPQVRGSNTRSGANVSDLFRHGSYSPTTRFYSVGFRIARSVPPRPVSPPSH